MSGKKKQEIEFQYYEIPHGERLLALSEENQDAAHGRMRFHNLLEVGYCAEGYGTMAFCDYQALCGPGTITVIPPNIPHATSMDGGQGRWKYLFLNPEELLGEFYPDNPLFARKILELANRKERYYQPGQQSQLTVIINMIADESECRGNYSGEYVRGLLLSMLMCIARGGAEEAGMPDAAASRGGMGQLSAALDYIGKSYMEHIKVKELAEACNLSETHFRRLFVEYMGMTPSSYLNLVRVQQARNLMRKTSYSMEEVAMRVGYASVSSFNRNFRDITGTSPYRYKKGGECSG